MLYGGFLLKETNCFCLDLLEKTISWPGSFHQIIDFKNFSGGFFAHKGLPKQEEDFFFLDKRSNTLLMLWGNIYSLDKEPNLCFSKNAPEKILRIFEKMGPSIFSDLNGDFSLIIYQAEKQKIFLVRDHLGVNPLAFCFENNELFFSTDTISLCKVFSNTSQFNIKPLLSDFRFVDNTQTVNPKIKKVSPGHYVEFDFKSVQEKKYWFPEKIKTERHLTFDSAIREAKELLIDAVAVRSDPRFSASAHISGGLDSSLIGVLAKKNYALQKDFFGFSWSPEDFFDAKCSFDERDLVNELCAQNDITPSFIPFNQKTITSVFRESKNLLPSTFEDHVINIAKQKRINLIFSGWGGQEFLSMGNRGLDIDLISRFQWSTFLLRHPVTNPKKFLKALLFQVFFPALHIPNPITLRRFSEYTRYLKKPYNKIHYKTYKNFNFFRSRRQHHLGIINTKYLSERTENWAVNGFKNGVEYRYPLLDKRIVEFVLKLPSNILVHQKQSRFLFREVAKGILPESIRLRESTIDPVIQTSFSEYTLGLKEEFLQELESMKSNPHMQFVDFELLEKDLINFSKIKASKHKTSLTDTMLSLIIIHEFLKKYFSDQV